MKYSSETATIELIEQNLVRLEYYDNAEVNLEAAQLDYKLYLKLVQDRRVKHLVIGGAETQLSPDAMKFIKHKNEQRKDKIIAEAIVTGSLAQRLLGNFYFRILRPNYNVRMFTDQARALSWLSTIDADNGSEKVANYF